MGWPQWTLLALFFVSVLIAANRHGQRRTDKHSLPVTLVALLIELSLLYAGGFFSPPVQAQVPAASARHKLTLLRAAQTEWGLNAPVAALAAQVHQESAWNPQAVSRVGARGLAQFMPATASWWCERAGTAAADCLPHNPTWALRAMVGYDRFLFERAPAYLDRFDRYWLALRAYNGGEAHVRAEALKTGSSHPSRAQIDLACGKARRAPVHCAENLDYPRRILLQLQPRYAGWGPVLEP